MDTTSSRMARRLEQTSAGLDFGIICILAFLLFLMLRLMQSMNLRWKAMMNARIIAALKKRKTVTDGFRSENGFSWDYVIVFKVYGHNENESKVQIEYNMKFILHALSESGLETKLFYSVQCNQVYCKVRAPLKRLLIEADKIDYKLPLDSSAIANYLSEGKRRKLPPGTKPKEGEEDKEEWIWAPVIIPENALMTFIPPYEYIYAEYQNRAEINYLYKKWENNSVLRGVDRLKLIMTIIKSHKRAGGASLDIFKLTRDKCIDSSFPLHDFVELRTLEQEWFRICQAPWSQNVDVAKDYFGEKIGLYFLFCGHYTTWLIYASIVGFLCWLQVAAEKNNPNAESMPYFAAFMALWSTLFLEFWKRKEKTYGMRWGMVGFEEEEITRPQFVGTEAPNPVDGKKYLYFSTRKFYSRIISTAFFVFSLILVVIAVIAAIFFMRIQMNKNKDFTINGVATGSIIASILNAVQIQVFNTFFGNFAIICNDFENHRTDTHYEDALIAKTFVFQFVNSFASLFYIAFIKPYIPQYDECLGNCMGELQTTLGTIFLTRLTVGNFTAVAVPAITRRMKEKEMLKSEACSESGISEVEHTANRGTYDVMLGTFNDYAGMIIQFGYATMFICAFPLAVINAFVNNYVALRIDAWKLCQEFRRPEPRSQEDIGTWYTILEIISFFAVITNSALVAFTGTFLFNYTYVARTWIFIVMAGGILGVKYFIAFLVPDIPQDVDIQLQRQKFIVDKILYDAQDDVDDEFGRNSELRMPVEMTIRITDDDPL